MISLDVYARYVYQYSSTATTEHLRRTVWEPLGLVNSHDNVPASPLIHPHFARYESLYALPPITTNVRWVGKDVEARMAATARALVPSSTPTAPVVNSGDDEDGDIFHASVHTAAGFSSPTTLASVGLPFCLCLIPRIDLLTWWPPCLHPERAACASGPHPEALSEPLVIVVDVGAAEAVLRGSDLYAPGVVTVSRPFSAGARALIAFYVEREAAMENDGEAVRTGVLPPHRLRSALPAGASLSAEMYVPHIREETAEKEDGRSGWERWVAGRSSFLVCVGSGVMRMGWKSIMGLGAHGIALRTDWTPQGQPSRSTLRTLLGGNACTRACRATQNCCKVVDRDTPVKKGEVTRDVEGVQAWAVPVEEANREDDAFFLQNYTSMVPVALLMDHLDRFSSCPIGEAADSAGPSPQPYAILDACAAPGGKTSLLLSLLLERTERKKAEASIAEGSNAAEMFQVVCCERSRPRQEQLTRLLHAHFTSDNDASREASVSEAVVSLFSKGVLKLHCADTNKFLKSMSTARAGDLADADGIRRFDAVLLDPPCTGMGLRPKLLPHAQTIRSIEQAADYQRKLFDSCIRHVRCSPTSPGVLVYSTCTITREENEANVLHFLKMYPFVRLARAKTTAQRALCRLSVTTHPKQKREVDDRETCGIASLREAICEVQQDKERAAGVSPRILASVQTNDPLLMLRFSPSPLDSYTDFKEDSVGFFVAVFLCSAPADA